MKRMNRKRARRCRARRKARQRIRVFAKRLRRQVRFFIKDRYYKDSRLNFAAILSDIWKAASIGYKLFKHIF